MTSSAVVLAATVIKVSFFKFRFYQFIILFRIGGAQTLNLGFGAILNCFSVKTIILNCVIIAVNESGL